MKTIDTLIEDIQGLLALGIENIEIPEEVLSSFEENFRGTVTRQLEAVKEPSRLRMSNIGVPCERKLWYSVNEADNDDREALKPEVRLKFIYGDLTEELLLLLAKLSGHTVELTQKEVSIGGIKGHWDAVIDGVVVDVKSATTFSFNKFRDGRLSEDDPFGYIPQLMSYLYCAQEVPEVTEKEKAAFLVFDKQLGHICLDVHKKVPWFDQIPEVVEHKKSLVDSEDVPERSFSDEPDGAKGNRKLGLFCSYCDFKKVCYPNLKVFLYSGRPRFLTEVRNTPNVPEGEIETQGDLEYRRSFI